MSVLHRDNEGRIWIRIRAHEEQLAAKDAEIKQLGAELQKMERAHVSELAAKNREIAALKAEVERLKQELAQPWKHSEHWRNPETGQVECECCCSWALDCEKEHKELVTLREQVSRLSAPLTHKEWKKNFILNATDDVYSEDKDGFDGVIAARLEGK